MSVPEPRDTEEREKLEAAMRSFREESGAADTFMFNDLVRQWERLVDGLERHSYELSFSDYIHELQQRDAIDEVRASLPRRLADELESYLELLDSRFRFATIDTGRPLLDDDLSDAFWWSRVPKRIGSEFSQELASRDS